METNEIIHLETFFVFHEALTCLKILNIFKHSDTFMQRHMFCVRNYRKLYRYSRNSQYSSKYSSTTIIFTTFSTKQMKCATYVFNLLNPNIYALLVQEYFARIAEFKHHVFI